MNPEWFGDSFDIVKRYFIEVLKSAGFHVYVDPMFTGDGESIKKQYHAFLGAPQYNGQKSFSGKTALLIDPDTGVGKRKTEKHITLSDIAKELEKHNIVFSFDQSFSRSRSGLEQMMEKLGNLFNIGCYAFYYDSHARFLFAASSEPDIKSVISALHLSGLPQARIVQYKPTM